MAIRIVQTRDGSPTLFSESYNQHYHNINGALTESRHVFFEKTGLREALSKDRPVVIHETGFGSGLHFLLTLWYRKTLSSSSPVRFYSVEKEPIDKQTFLALRFSTLLPNMNQEADSLTDFFDRLASSRPGSILDCFFPTSDGVTGVSNRKESGTGLSLSVFHGPFEAWPSSSITHKAGFFLHDAFSPEVNPELWTRKTFATLLNRAEPNAVLGTYCSATKARAEMVLGGWHVARAPGPPGKREMTLASPAPDRLKDFKQLNEKRLIERFGNS